MTRNTPPSSDASIRQVLGELIDQAGHLPTWPDVVEHAIEPTPPERSRWIAPLLAAACVAVLVVGLVVVFNDSPPRDPTASPPVPSVPVSAPPVAGVSAIELTTAQDPTQLGEVTSLERDQWVAPTVMADGFDFRYSARLQGDQLMEFGDDAPFGREIRVGIVSQWFAGSGDRTEVVDASGATWKVVADDQSWSAWRPLGPVTVVVFGAGLTDATGLAIVESLVVVDEAELVNAPLSENDGLTVATGNTPDGEATLSANASGDWYCTPYQSRSGGGAGCGQFFDPRDVVNDLGAGFSQANGALEIDVTSTGIAIPDADRIEIEFIDGTTAEAIPTDLSGSFDVEFWIVGATVALDDPDQTNRILSPVIEIRAYDADGRLIATSR